MESFPVINMKDLEGEETDATMKVISSTCENWDFFEVLFIYTYIYQSIFILTMINEWSLLTHWS